jgi:hypothetical protein
LVSPTVTDQLLLMGQLQVERVVAAGVDDALSAVGAGVFADPGIGVSESSVRRASETAATQFG